MRYAVLITLAALVALVVPPMLQAPDPPWWIPVGLFAVGVVWSWSLFFFKSARTAMFLGVLQLVVGGAIAYWMFGLSTYEAPDGAPRAEAPAPDFEAVRVVDGAEFRLSAWRGRPVVLVFFRGTW